MLSYDASNLLNIHCRCLLKASVHYMRQLINGQIPTEKIAGYQCKFWVVFGWYSLYAIWAPPWRDPRRLCCDKILNTPIRYCTPGQGSIWKLIQFERWPSHTGTRLISLCYKSSLFLNKVYFIQDYPWSTFSITSFDPLCHCIVWPRQCLGQALYVQRPMLLFYAVSRAGDPLSSCIFITSCLWSACMCTSSSVIRRER